MISGKQLRLLGKGIYKSRIAYLFILPAVVIFLVFTYWPVVETFRLSFFEYNVFLKHKFIGLDNYANLIKDKVFWRVMGNTVTLAFLYIAFGFWVPLFLALMLNEVVSTRLKRAYQTIYFMPHLISWVVIGNIFLILLGPDFGLVNLLIKSLGGEPIFFFQSGGWIRPVLVVVNTWKTAGWFVVIYLAALTGIDPELYEAAEIDGASRWQQIRWITLPLLKSTMVVVLLLNTISIMQTFDQVYVMVKPIVYDQADVIMTYMYRTGILRLKMGLASAMGVVLFSVIFILSMINVKLTGYGAFEE